MREVEYRKHVVCHETLALKDRRKQIERGPEATAARAQLTRIENEAELARLRLVRNELLTIEGLAHTN
ncbi:hypothetical protein EOD29_32390, partial [Mesorhizobium sp. M1A.T.Ca.IN.004.03.1.1]